MGHGAWGMEKYSLQPQPFQLGTRDYALGTGGRHGETAIRRFVISDLGFRILDPMPTGF
jgi:hypothetical protein